MRNNLSLNVLHITTIGEKAVLERLARETDMGGGIGVGLIRTAKVLENKLNCKSFITISSEGNFLKTAKKEGFETTVIRSKWISFFGRPLFVVLSVPQLVNLMKIRHIDIVHAYNFAAALTGGIAAKIVGIPMVISVHQNVTEYKTLSRNMIRRVLNLIRGKITNKIFRFASRFGKPIIALSDYVKESLIKNGFNESRINVWYRGIDIFDTQSQDVSKLNLREQMGFSKDAFLVGSVGRLHKDKGYQYLIKAAPEIIDRIPQARFILVGDGVERAALETAAYDLGVSENFVFMGHRDDVLDLLKEFDLFVLPSFTEGLPSAVLEAMAACKPIVATKVGGLPELIEDKKTGLFIPPKNSQALAEAVISLFNDKNLASELAKNAYNKALNDFSLDKRTKELYKIYINAVSKRRNGKKLLVLNIKLSGVNKHLFGALKKKGWDLEFIDVPVPRLCKYFNLLRTFAPNKKIWRDRYYETLGKTPSSFIRRTRFCGRAIKKLEKQHDVIFQIGGMFAPSLKKLSLPYVTYNDYTMKLAEREYPAWAPFSSQRMAKKWYQLEGKLYKNADKVLTFSERTGRSVKEDYGVDRGRVIALGSGANLDKIPVINDRTYDKNTILFIGVDFERKGGYVLLEAFKKVRGEIPSARLVVVGPDSIGVDLPGVECRGLIKDRSEVGKLYREASLFVMPSLGDPFPNVIFEAMAHKLPCVGTNASGIPEQIEDGKTGFIVGVNDADGLAQRITELLKDKELMKQMGEAGYRKVIDVFNWDKAAERINNELESVLPIKDNKIKVMHISYSLDMGGLEKLILDLTRSLDKRRFTASVCSLSNGLGLHSEFTKLGVPVYAKPKKEGIDYLLVLKLVHFLRKMDVDVVHTHNPSALLYGGLAAKLAGRYLVHTEHSNLFKHKRKLMLAESIMLRFTDCIVCDTDNVKKEMSEKHRIRENRIKVIVNGINVGQFGKAGEKNVVKNKFGFNNKDLIIGNVGRLDPVKDQNTLIEAFSIVNKQYDNLKLVIVGEGKLKEELKLSAKREGLADKVIFLGERKDIPEILQLLDVFVLSSLYEGMSLALLEAMAAAKPIIATNVGGNPEVVVNKETGFLVPPKSADKLAEAIIKSLQNPEMLKKMGQAGRKRVEEYFSLEKMLNEYEDVYSQGFGKRAIK